MSRIPKIGGGPSGSKENSLPLKGSSSNLGFKRPSDDHLVSSMPGKRLKINSSEVAKKKVLSSVQPSLLKNKSYSTLKAKQAILPPIPDTGLIRSSMPAVTSTTHTIPGKSRRPAWDLKGRIQDMEEKFRHREEEAIKTSQRIAALESRNSFLEKDLDIKVVMTEEATSQIKELNTKLKQKTEEYESVLKENESLNREKEKISRELTDLKALYDQEVSALKSTVTSLTCSKSRIQAQLDALESLFENQKSEVKHLKNKCEEQDSIIKSQEEIIAQMKAKILQEETWRRQLHNTIQELKGNVRVFCRLRPPLDEEVKNGMNLLNIVPITENTITIQQLPEVGLNESGGKTQQKYEFSFDYYFSQSSSQEAVFQEISQLVQSALDGYNVCIFAYGQTGSGKTFTMEGPADIEDFIENKNHPKIGMIPRSVQQIFCTIADLESKGWKYSVQTMFMEIYNERIQDLLSPPGSNVKCEIVQSGSKGNDCVVSNLTAVEVDSAEQVFDLIKKARINRVVAATKSNKFSSRSHFVFQMKIHGKNSLTGEKCDATLNLVDLAGSERVKDSESTGSRLTEAKAINKSLSALGKVILSLSKKDSHVPYRDSKLTHLLSNSLGGNSKCLMFVNISPDNRNLNETLNSLRFATKVNQCDIGTARKRIS